MFRDDSGSIVTRIRKKLYLIPVIPQYRSYFHLSSTHLFFVNSLVEYTTARDGACAICLSLCDANF